MINLATILINIAEEGGDIGQSLAKYRDEIVKKVTSNIYKHNVWIKVEIIFLLFLIRIVKLKFILILLNFIIDILFIIND